MVIVSNQYLMVVPLYMNGILGAVFQSDIKILHAIWSEVTIFVIPEKGDNKVGRKKSAET